MSEQELAWLAGILEGEGSFCRTTIGKQPRISMASIDKDVIETIAKLLGNANIHTYKCKMPNSKQLYRVEISGSKAKPFMRLILPYMHFRRKKRIEELLMIADGFV